MNQFHYPSSMERQGPPILSANQFYTNARRTVPTSSSLHGFAQTSPYPYSRLHTNSNSAFIRYDVPPQHSQQVSAQVHQHGLYMMQNNVHNFPGNSNSTLIPGQTQRSLGNTGYLEQLLENRLENYGGDKWSTTSAQFLGSPFTVTRNRSSPFHLAGKKLPPPNVMEDFYSEQEAQESEGVTSQNECFNGSSSGPLLHSFGTAATAKVCLKDDETNLKSHKRFNENNRKMREVLSETVVSTDWAPTVETLERVTRLRKYVTLLKEDLVRTIIPKKFHKEDTTEVITKCEKRKIDFLESTTKFNSEYEKLCEPIITQKTMDDMEEKMYLEIKTQVQQGGDKGFVKVSNSTTTTHTTVHLAVDSPTNMGRTDDDCMIIEEVKKAEVNHGQNVRHGLHEQQEHAAGYVGGGYPYEQHQGFPQQYAPPPPNSQQNHPAYFQQHQGQQLYVNLPRDHDGSMMGYNHSYESPPMHYPQEYQHRYNSLGDNAYHHQGYLWNNRGSMVPQQHQGQIYGDPRVQMPLMNPYPHPHQNPYRHMHPNYQYDDPVVVQQLLHKKEVMKNHLIRLIQERRMTNPYERIVLGKKALPKLLPKPSGVGRGGGEQRGGGMLYRGGIPGRDCMAGDVMSIHGQTMMPNLTAGYQPQQPENFSSLVTHQRVHNRLLSGGGVVEVMQQSPPTALGNGSAVEVNNMSCGGGGDNNGGGGDAIAGYENDKRNELENTWEHMPIIPIVDHDHVDQVEIEEGEIEVTKSAISSTTATPTLAKILEAPCLNNFKEEGKSLDVLDKEWFVGLDENNPEEEKEGGEENWTENFREEEEVIDNNFPDDVLDDSSPSMIE